MCFRFLSCWSPNSFHQLKSGFHLQKYTLILEKAHLYITFLDQTDCYNNFFFSVSHTFYSALKCALLSEISHRYPYYHFFIFFWTKPEGRTSLESFIIQNFIALFWMCWNFSTLLLKYTHPRTKLALFYGPVRIT